MGPWKDEGCLGHCGWAHIALGEGLRARGMKKTGCSLTWCPPSTYRPLAGWAGASHCDPGSPTVCCLARPPRPLSCL